MNWFLIAEIIYIIIIVLACLKIIYDTDSTIKTLAYLLLTIFLPFVGIFFYFSFGINYRKNLIYTKKLVEDEVQFAQLRRDLIFKTETNTKKYFDIVKEGVGLVNLLLNDTLSPLTSRNYVKVLLNGEEKFPEVFKVLEAATHHIHIEYYIYENDEIGNQLKDLLIRKAKEGVEVRLIYDDFGSRSIRKKLVKELRSSGVQAFPFNRIILLFLANRLNYRNHRKIIVVDGKCGFVGGINISDRYINKNNSKERIYWRDTHVRIDGLGMHYLQRLFLCDWNFCSREKILFDNIYFRGTHHQESKIGVQIAASGPDSPTSTIMLSLFKAISIAKKEILITTPYFIPGETLLDALRVAALSGVTVKLLVPGVSDSKLVNAAAWSYYGDLLRVGVQIYLYRKGFLHAKTMVIDDYLSIVGTANMDFRSFDINFEVNAILYAEETASQLREAFNHDLQNSEQIVPAEWEIRPMRKQLPEKVARLLSPLL